MHNVNNYYITKDKSDEKGFDSTEDMGIIIANQLPLKNPTAKIKKAKSIGSHKRLII